MLIHPSFMQFRLSHRNTRLLATLSLPYVTVTSLSRITRSAQHALELLNTSPFVLVVLGDNAVPPHPILGTEL